MCVWRTVGVVVVVVVGGGAFLDNVCAGHGGHAAVDGLPRLFRLPVRHNKVMRGEREMGRERLCNVRKRDKNCVRIVMMALEVDGPCRGLFHN